MSETDHRASPYPGSSKSRRHDIERRLAELGLIRGPRRVFSRDPRPLSKDSVIVRLRSLLAESGPVFRAFGRYLSRRADVLSVTDCLALENLDDQGTPLPSAAVDARILEELGQPGSEAFRWFEEQPFESRWFDQSHRARLAGGERVVVRLLQRDLESVAEDLDALASLERAFTGSGLCDEEHFGELVADFRRVVADSMDFSAQADALQILGRDARRSDLLVVPQIYRDLSTTRMLTRQWLPGATVAELAAQPSLQAVDAEDVARRLCLAWLQVALVGHRFPVEAEMLELPDGRLAITHGVFAELPEGSRVNLWNYLRSTAEHFPDRAAAYLLKEVESRGPGAIAGELRARIRQVVPFRDGSWSRTGESLGEYALLHWRALREVGFHPRAHLDQFYQGLFWAVAGARKFMPQGDPMGEALRDFDWLAGWNQLRQLTAPQQLGSTLEAYLEGAVELPQKIDRALDLAADDRRGFRIPDLQSPGKESPTTSLAPSLATSLAMVAVALLAEPWHRLASALGLSEAWGEGLLAMAFLGLGALLLLSLVRRPSRSGRVR